MKRTERPLGKDAAHKAAVLNKAIVERVHDASEQLQPLIEVTA